MDYRIYHAIDEFVRDHPWVGHVFSYVESWGVVALVLATVLLWVVDRPGDSRHWKIVSGSALGSAALGVGINKLISTLIWYRPRPYVTHPGAFHPYEHAHDASFPSDHTSGAFGLAFAIFLFDRLVGSLFLAAAVLIAAGRLLIGAHYPADVGAGFLVGLASAIVVVKLARPVIDAVARLVERLTDPLLAPLWRLARR